MTNGSESTTQPPFRGGRLEAERRLALIDPARYATSRNHLDGAVTRLSPYIRHGVLSLAEVREAVFARLRLLEPPPGSVQGDLFGAGEPPRGWSQAQRKAGEKLINELGWRDYWQRLWLQLGDGIWEDREPLKTGHRPDSYAGELPADLASASTGLACIDGFASELMATGWLHNHARMWLASYVVHWRRVRWQAGARWFLTHLLDGDPASNNLSWQWVASAFSHKPYIFNRANLERFSSGRHCDHCPKARSGCPFEASYEALQAQLFRAHDPRSEPSLPAPATGNPSATLPSLLGPPAARQQPEQQPPSRPLVWVHGEALGPSNPALIAHAGAPAVFVFDGELIAGRTPSSGGHPAVGDRPVPLASGRLRFLRECLAELPAEVRDGDVARELLAAAAGQGCDGIVTSRAVDPRFAAIARRLSAVLPLQILEPQPFVELPVQGQGSPDLGRFSRYWRKAEPRVWGETVSAPRKARRQQS
ncbi:MAG: FAD-binding domain-containing protein [Cyanobium sp.]